VESIALHFACSCLFAWLFRKAGYGGISIRGYRFARIEGQMASAVSGRANDSW
jgi:hypothetical protein